MENFCVHTPLHFYMVQTNRFGAYTVSLSYMPLFSIVYVRVAFSLVVITVYNDSLLPIQLCACIIIVEYSISITLGENILGNSQNGVGFGRLTNRCFYAIIETSFYCVEDAVKLF